MTGGGVPGGPRRALLRESASFVAVSVCGKEVGYFDYHNVVAATGRHTRAPHSCRNRHKRTRVSAARQRRDFSGAQVCRSQLSFSLWSLWSQPTTEISFSTRRTDWSLNLDRPTLPTTDTHKAMADEQYQDDDRSAAKTLWLGDVQVRVLIFSCAVLAKDCLLCSCRMLAWDFTGKSSSPPLCVRRIPNGWVAPGLQCD